MQTWFDFDWDIIDTAINQWLDRLRLCACWTAIVDTMNTRSEMSVHLYDLPEHYMKLST